MNRALICGIDQYDGAPLRGCVHDGDATAVAKAMVKLGYFREEEIHLLCDKRATTERMLDRLRWLVVGAAAGDRLLFWYSGHGTTLPLRDKNGDMISSECAICPVDFDFTPQHAITTSNFAEVFANIPEGVIFQWVSDSCHSGDLTRAIVCDYQNNRGYRVPRQYPMPADLMWRQRTAEKLGMKSEGLSRALPEHLHGAFIGGCKTNQTSSDAYRHDRYCGACSSILLEKLQGPGGTETPLTKLIEAVNEQLRVERYEQEPQIHGNPEHIARPWLLGD